MIKKTHKKIPKTLTSNRYLLKFGSYGFKILSNLCLRKDQILSLEKNLLKKLKNTSSQSKTYKLWSLLKTNKTLTKLNLESRMGKGKGAIYTEVLFLKKGTIIYEFENLNKQQVKGICQFIKKQLSTNLFFVVKK